MALVKDIVTALAAVTGAGVAVMGLSTWKAQLRGRAEYELARRILRTTYRVRDEIASVRRPLMTPGEISQALKEAGIEPKPGPTSHPRTDEAVYQKRWDRLAEALSDLRVEEREAEVLWGRDIRSAFASLHDCVSKLHFAIYRHVRDVSESSAPHQTRRLSPEDRQEVDAVIYQLSDDPEKDQFTGEISEAVEEVENRVRPHLKISRPLISGLWEKFGSS